MKTEKEIRKEVKNSLNIIKNSEFLYERTTAISFKKKAEQNNIWRNALLWVLDEFEPQDEIITLDTKSGDITS